MTTAVHLLLAGGSNNFRKRKKKVYMLHTNTGILEYEYTIYSKRNARVDDRAYI